MTKHLRSLKVDDLETVLQWRNHPDVRRYMYSQHEITLSEHKAWFEKNYDLDNFHLLIYEQDGIPSGFVKLQVLDNVSRRADWGFYLSPEAPKGSGSFLGKLTLEYAFIDIGLHKLCGEVLECNIKSLRFHEKLGFIRESLLRDHFYDGKSYHNVIGFGLIHDVWKTRL